MRRALEEARRGGTLSVALVGDERMADLNRRYRGREGATDVLAFPLGEGGDPGPWGEVVVSVETARRQAREWGGDERDEIALLAVHGTLHLLGWDDDGVQERRRMLEEARRILRGSKEEKGEGWGRPASRGASDMPCED